MHHRLRAIVLFAFLCLSLNTACVLRTVEGSPSPLEITLQVVSTEIVSQGVAPPTSDAGGISPPPEAILPTPTESQTSTPEPSPTPEVIRFAVIGDYGEGNQAEMDVANLVKSWSPDFIITTGDNNYPIGSAETIDARVGQYYHEYIFPYLGSYGEGADQNRFFPTMGNHDWDTIGAQPYIDYFTLPGNERYYDFTWGPIHFFALNSDSREPDGVGSSSVQAMWLQEKVTASTSSWKIVFMHHPPYSSAYHGPVDWMVWPFQEWGASAVLSGHDHVYERLLVDDLAYFINGLGGGPIYWFGLTFPGSQVRFNSDYGAMLVDASDRQITFQFITRLNQVIDTFQLVNK